MASPRVGPRRPRPIRSRSSVVALVLSLAAVCVGPAAATETPAPGPTPSSAAVDAARADLDESTAEVADAIATLHATEAALAKASSAKAEADRTVDLARTRYDAAALMVARAQTLLSLMQQASEGAQSDLLAARVEAGAIARNAYVQGPLSDLEGMAELLQSGRLGALQDRRVALASVGRALVDRTAELTVVAENYSHEANAMAHQRDAVFDEQRRLADTLDALDESRRHADGLAVALAAAVDEHATALAAAQSAAAEDERRYQELVDEGTTGVTGTSHLPRLTPQVAASDAQLLAPAEGPITSPFGMRRHPITGVYKLHTGTDFGVPCGTLVHAAADGTVLSATVNRAYGNRLVLTHEALGLLTTYNHLTSFLVTSGATVHRGDIIALSGTTGYSTGCHLHFEVVVDSNYVDPVPWLAH